MSQLDALGLPTYDLPAHIQAEIDALERTNSNDPHMHDEVQKRHELNRERVKDYRWEGQEQFTRERMGRILSQSEFLRLLHQVDGSFFYNNFSVDGLVGLNVMERGEPTYTGVAVQRGWMPEYEQIRLDEHGLPGRSKYRGWRTVLLRLIQNGLIREDDANRVFGPATGPESGPYLQQLYAIRNSK